MTVEDRAGKENTDKAQAKEAQHWASAINQVRALPSSCCRGNIVKGDTAALSAAILALLKP